MRTARLICTLGLAGALAGLSGCAGDQPLAGPAAYNYNQPVQQGTVERVQALDGSTRLEFRPLEDQNLTGTYSGIPQPGAYRGAQGSSR